MSASYRSVLLGELLLSAGLISEHQLKEALLRARETKLPVGKLLVLDDAVTQEELHEAVDVQSLVHDKIMDFEEGAERLAGLRRGRNVVSAPSALSPGPSSSRNLIGQLLLDSGLIDGPQLAQAFPVHRDTGLPLGRVLVYTAGLNSAHLSAAIVTQLMVRSGRLTRERAVQLLKSIKDDVSADSALSGMALDEERTLLMRKLLLGARLVREAPMLIALEVAIADAQPLEAVLVQSALCSEKTVEVASQLCNELQQGKITNVAAVQKLQEAAGSLQDNDEKGGARQFSPSDLLRLSRIVSDADVKLVAPQLDLKPSQPHSDVVPDLALCAALECHGLLERGVITAERAIVALYLCLNKGLPLDQVLGQLAPESAETSPL